MLDPRPPRSSLLARRRRRLAGASHRAASLLWTGRYRGRDRSGRLDGVVGRALAGLRLRLRERDRRPLQTLSNLLAALREDDFSIRARGADRDDPLGAGAARGQTARRHAARRSGSARRRRRRCCAR